jgi:hypothetical protein
MTNPDPRVSSPRPAPAAETAPIGDARDEASAQAAARADHCRDLAGQKAREDFFWRTCNAYVPY